MKSAKQMYEGFWDKHNDEVSSYPRNKALLGLFNEGELVLDVGCGDGKIAKFLQETMNVKVIGVDISENAIKKAKKLGIDAKVVDAEDAKLPFDTGTFDVVFWGDNIEHLFDPEKTGREIRRVLKSGGRLILSTPNFGYFRYRLYYLLHGRLPDTEWTGFKPWGWSHIRFFNMNILRDFLKEIGFRDVVKIIGVSSRRIDKVLIRLSPELFGMILVVEAR